MGIRADTLPTDSAMLTEMMLALDAENEQLRADEAFERDLRDRFGKFDITVYGGDEGPKL
jgi:hypothetical protein